MNISKKEVYEQLSSTLSYNPHTGIFRYTRNTANNRLKKGQVAGSTDSRGYVTIATTIKRDGEKKLRQIRAHRLAWFMHYGEIPPDDRDIDHIDGFPSNNQIDNLRLITRGDNLRSARKMSSSNTSGYTGVSRFIIKKTGYTKWRASIQHKGKTHTTYHDTHSEAVEARKALEKKFNRPPSK